MKSLWWSLLIISALSNPGYGVERSATGASLGSTENRSVEIPRRPATTSNQPTGSTPPPSAVPPGATPPNTAPLGGSTSREAIIPTRPTEETAPSARASTRATENRTPDGTPRDTPAPSTSTYNEQVNHQPPPVILLNAKTTASLETPDDTTSLIYNEWIVTSDSVAQANMERDLLSRYGARIKKRQNFIGLGMVITTYRTPTNADTSALLNQIKREQPDLSIEFNQYFFLSGEASHGTEYARKLVKIPNKLQTESSLSIAMLDALVNKQLPVFHQANLTVVNMVKSDQTPSAHGTSVASLIVGNGHPVQGAAPQATLLAINIFEADDKKKLKTRTDLVLAGLNHLGLLTTPPHAVNLSFGGGFSRPIARAIERLSLRTTFIAAAGNGGPSAPPVYPAALKDVIAVTAVDQVQRLYRKANRGDYVAIAAPGVDVWASDSTGQGYYASGTSFAAPWVTAAIAYAKAQKLPIKKLLVESLDLGTPGRDPLFGYGLLQWPRE